MFLLHFSLSAVLALLPVSMASGPNYSILKADSNYRMLQQLSADEEAALLKCDDAATSFGLANPSVQDATTALATEGSAGLSQCLEQFKSLTEVLCELDYKSFQGGSAYNTLVESCSDAGGILLEHDYSASCTSGPLTMSVTSNAPVCLPPDDACDPEVITSLLETSFVCTLDISASAGWGTYYHGAIMGIISFIVFLV
jgi:hypothetical protein